MSWFTFVHYPEAQLEWPGRLPTLGAVSRAGSEPPEEVIRRCFAAASLWAREQGLPALVGEPAEVRTAEVIRAEWFRQGFSDHGVLRQTREARSWLCFIEHQLIGGGL